MDCIWIVYVITKTILTCADWICEGTKQYLRHGSYMDCICDHINNTYLCGLNMGETMDGWALQETMDCFWCHCSKCHENTKFRYCQCLSLSIMAIEIGRTVQSMLEYIFMVVLNMCCFTPWMRSNIIIWVPHIL